MGFPEELKSFRKKAKLSQMALADAVGVSFTTINRWETGKVEPNFKTLKLLNDYCKSIGVDHVFHKTYKPSK